MKKLNVRRKIMFWHGIALFVVSIAVLPITYLVISSHLYRGAENLLISQADEITRLLRTGGVINAPCSGMDLVKTGTYIAVYSNDDQLISGRLPDDFDRNLQPVFDGAYYKSAAGHSWVVLDRELVENGKVTGWIRVIKTLDAINSALEDYRTLICIIIPILILFSAFMTIISRIIVRTLSSVRHITDTARQIEQGDLSKRINLEGSRNEVGVLAETFDKMIDRLEDSFDRAKCFSADVSHELRTPVTAIIVTAEEALDGDKTTEEYKENLNTILLEGRKMNSLISQLLMMARSLSGKNAQEMEFLDISKLTRTIVEDVTAEQESSGIMISADIDDGIVMVFDQTLFMRLLYNLIDNALKYNVPGGWVRVSLKKRDSTVILSVGDGGIGISEEDLPRIWNRFYKADCSAAGSSPGLGLSIVRWIAEQFGGTVGVTSELGKGSLFEVRFQL
ncbi:MAG: HAMP domain-containing sensor histidine kinase [Oscillospiraceae bacterium]|nr:HAMP domain-containing sensor histidine kinase [Oscillospiraceae bacterium]